MGIACIKKTNVDKIKRYEYFLKALYVCLAEASCNIVHQEIKMYSYRCNTILKKKDK